LVVRPLVDFYFMVFIHIGTRQIWISPCTENPTGDWTTQQGRNFQMHIDDHDLKCETLMRDRDRKYVDSLDDVFKTSECKIKLTPIRSPNLQAHVERAIQTIKHEMVNAFCIVTNEHLNGILRTTQSWYNECRGHSERDHLPPMRNKLSLPLRPFSKERVVCDALLGVHLVSYRRAV
jgi:putative transposase